MKTNTRVTCEAGEVFLQVRCLDFVSQDVRLIEEEDDGGVEKPRRMDGGVEQSQTLMHTVLKKKTHSQISYWRLQHFISLDRDGGLIFVK